MIIVLRDRGGVACEQGLPWADKVDNHSGLGLGLGWAGSHVQLHVTYCPIALIPCGPLSHRVDCASPSAWPPAPVEAGHERSLRPPLAQVSSGMECQADPGCSGVVFQVASGSGGYWVVDCTPRHQFQFRCPVNWRAGV